MTTRLQCPYQEIVKNEGMFCNIKSEWVESTECEQCPVTHTSPQAPAERIPPCKDCPVETPHCRKNCRYYEMYVLGAKAEREQAIKEVYDAMISSDEIRGDCMRDAIRVLESLRAQQGGVSE